MFTRNNSLHSWQFMAAEGLVKKYFEAYKLL